MSSIKSFIFSLFACCLLVLVGCGDKSAPPIKVGTIAGPETDMMKIAKDVAKQKYGLDIQIVEFSDYSMPNTALAEGAIDVNMFQHQPYLDVVLEKKKYELVSIGKTFVYPMGVYSARHKSLVEVPQEAKVGIPSDPSNEARALRLLAKAKFITIPENIDDISLTPQRVLQNPFYLKFKEMDAAQLPRALKELDFAVINTNYALLGGLKPYPDALLLEDADSPYANIVVVRSADKDNPKFQQLLSALHSKAVQEKAKVLFAGQAIPAWSAHDKE